MLSLEVLQHIWYGIIGISVLMYVLLDGFDLGVGILHPFARGDNERRHFLNSIGPVWDGNEVWLIMVVGGSLAGFPEAYATLLSGFYMPIMFLIFGLIFRAVSIEFRSKQPAKAWRTFWDYAFFGGSLLIALTIGLMLGNLIQGVELDVAHNFTGTFTEFFRPYNWVTAFATVTLFAMHGAIYLCMKTGGEVRKSVQRFVKPAIWSFVAAYLLLTICTFKYQPDMVQRFLHYPILFIFPLLTILTILNVPRQEHKGNVGWGFIMSCAAIFFSLVLFGVGIYPNIIISTGVGPSLTLYNASASQYTLRTLLIIAAIGVPLVLAYGYYIYRVFRGKVEIDDTSY